MDRRAKVAKIAAASVRNINMRFETKLDALIARVHNFYDRHMPLPDEAWTPNPEDPDYDGAVEKICDTAIDLLADFKMI